LYSAHQKTEEKIMIERRARLYTLVPIDELVSRGYLAATDNIDILESGVCSLLGIKSISENFSPAAAFRFGKHASIDQPSIAAWLKIIEQKSLKVKAAEFSVDSLKTAIPQIVANAHTPEKCSTVVDLLNRCGVKLVLEPPFKGTHIDGAVIYVNETPVIGMTMRLDRIDNFWFTLMHELGHIILNHRTGFVDVDVHDYAAMQASADETNANKWAAHTLISDNEYKKFVARTKPYFSRVAIMSFAESMGVHPGIVVGRLQRDGHVPWKNLRGFLERVSSYL
jgi:HTH-type transcriptional regulator/antitoxin HigA